MVSAVPAVAEVVETNAAAAVELPASYTPPAETQLSDREIWNRGYDYWKAGDMTNALATLQPLTLSRTHGARAAAGFYVRHANCRFGYVDA